MTLGEHSRAGSCASSAFEALVQIDLGWLLLVPVVPVVADAEWSLLVWPYMQVS